MPANLSPQYLAAEKRFKAAQSTAEKIEAVEEMLSTIPKHKGTEKMQADLKRRLFQRERTAEDFDLGRVVYKKQIELVGMMRRASVEFLSGTDVKIPTASLGSVCTMNWRFLFGPASAQWKLCRPRSTPRASSASRRMLERLKRARSPSLSCSKQIRWKTFGTRRR